MERGLEMSETEKSLPTPTILELQTPPLHTPTTWVGTLPVPKDLRARRTDKARDNLPRINHPSRTRPATPYLSFFNFSF